jgi:diphthamide synthase (EF-2-diphthine--ammonia ligase)
LGEEDDAVVMHGVPRALIAQQASSLGLALQVVTVPRLPPNTLYEARMAAALDRLASEGVRHIAFGDIFLGDVREYRELMLARAGFSGVFPLWGRASRELADSFRHAGYRAVAVRIDGNCLAPEFAGRDLDDSFFADLPAGVDPCGENGEFHSFVYDGPGFRYAVRFKRVQGTPAERFHSCSIAPLASDRCARCGAPFECGVQAGLKECWCAQLPPVAPLDAAAGCHCPRCLVEVSQAVVR